jgi:hypothetical protein
MKTLHWLRSKQEEKELSYWLSYAFYDMDDRSLNNKLYLVYLILFFSVWVFITLLFFASGGVKLLVLINPFNQVHAAAAIEALLLGGWLLFAVWRSLKQHPIVFSEKDAFLLNQSPAKRSTIILRWLWMPWLKTAFPFWMIAITLGFSIAENVFAGQNFAAHIPEYLGFGLRAWGIILPFQFSLYILPVMLGVIRLQKDKERASLLRRAFLSTLFVFTLILFFSSFPFFNSLLNVIFYPLQAAFSVGSVLPTIGLNLLFLLGLLILLKIISTHFNLTRAIQETQKTGKIQAAQREGDITLIQHITKQDKLGVMDRNYAWLPAYPDKRILIWKDWLQSLRTFQTNDLFHFAFLSGLMLSFAIVTNENSKIFLFILWVMQVGKMIVARFVNDLSHWVTLRQLPISARDLIFYEISSAYFLTLLLNFAGLGLGFLLSSSCFWKMGILMPSITASIALICIYDLCRQARASDLIHGVELGISVVGILLSILLAGIPYLITVIVPNSLGLIFALVLSLGFASISFKLAVRAYRKIGCRSLALSTSSF